MQPALFLQQVGFRRVHYKVRALTISLGGKLCRRKSVARELEGKNEVQEWLR